MSVHTATAADITAAHIGSEISFVTSCGRTDIVLERVRITAESTVLVSGTRRHGSRDRAAVQMALHPDTEIDFLDMVSGPFPAAFHLSRKDTGRVLDIGADSYGRTVNGTITYVRAGIGSAIVGTTDGVAVFGWA